MKKLSVLSLAVLTVFAFNAAAAEISPGYHVIKKIAVGGEGGWDYLTADSPSRKLYVSRGSHVIVVDMDANTVAGDIPDTQGVHGIAVAPSLNRGFTSNGKSNSVTIFDLKTLGKIGEVKVGDGPDAILFDEASGCVFTFNGGSKDATVIDAKTGSVKATIKLGGAPEYSVSGGNGMVYVNIEDTSEVAEIDTAKLAVTNRFSIKPGEEPSGMGFDPKNRLVFSGCRNKLMTVLDVRSGKVIADVPIGKGVDGNGFDRELGYAFSSNGADGTLTVVKEVSAGKFVPVQTVATQKSARTMAVDQKSHNIYLPAAEFGPMPVQTPGTGRHRPPIIKDSFVILVVGKQ